MELYAIANDQNLEKLSLPLPELLIQYDFFYNNIYIYIYIYIMN